MPDWTCRFFGSGTMVVTRDVASLPHFYVYGPMGADESETYQNRRKCCHELCEYLNGGTRPLWLGDMKRTQEQSIWDLDGTSIRATGPMVDIDPPSLNWKEDTSIQADDARARLIDKLKGASDAD